jgi:hypothetical protein
LVGVDIHACIELAIVKRLDTAAAAYFTYENLHRLETHAVAESTKQACFRPRRVSLVISVNSF